MRSVEEVLVDVRRQSRALHHGTELEVDYQTSEAVTSNGDEFTGSKLTTTNKLSMKFT
jgi:hypothetical protein